MHAFDYYNVLTDPNNHHSVYSGVMNHTVSSTPVDAAHPHELYYYTGGDDHPTAAGHQKATGEFIPFLNAVYNWWKSE